MKSANGTRHGAFGFIEKSAEFFGTFPAKQSASTKPDFEITKNMTNNRKASDKNSSGMKAMIIYDSFALAAKASSLLQSAAGKSSCEIEWEIKPWRANLLHLPNFVNEARTEADDAHLIVVAMENLESFPFWLEQWLEEWAAERKFEEAALAVLSEDPQGHLTLFPQAYRFASRQGLTFIYQPHETRGSVCVC
jgi:hypothetical protein